MNDPFERRIRAAAVAGWWVVLIGAVIVTVSWLGYLAAMSARPDWLFSLWGPDLSWNYVQNVWFWAVVTFKLIIWVMALVALWLTLWARQLHKVESRV